MIDTCDHQSKGWMRITLWLTHVMNKDENNFVYVPLFDFIFMINKIPNGEIEKKFIIIFN